MNNPLRILQTVDAHLDHPVRLCLYGRSALALGFDDPPAATRATQDVDAIIPLHQLEALQTDDIWWDAVEATNTALKGEGLYLAHLFDETQVILRPDWQQHRVAVSSPGLRFLSLERPATLDLILTKMMRGIDPQDMDDVGFYLQREPSIGTRELQEAFAVAVGPDIPELWDAFRAAQPTVLALARERPHRPTDPPPPMSSGAAPKNNTRRPIPPTGSGYEDY